MKNLYNFLRFIFKAENANFIKKCGSMLAGFSKFQLLHAANFFQFDTDGDENALSQLILPILSDVDGFHYT